MSELHLPACTSRFADIEEAKNLKIDYFRYLDAKSWLSLRSLFHDDAKFAGFPFPTVNADAFIEGVSTFLHGVDSVHQGFMPRMASTGAETIRAVWSMHDYLVWPRDSRDYRGAKVPGLYGIRGYGLYEEEYRRIDGHWSISVMRLVRTRIDLLTGEATPLQDQDFVAADPEWIPTRNDAR